MAAKDDDSSSVPTEHTEEENPQLNHIPSQRRASNSSSSISEKKKKETFVIEEPVIDGIGVSSTEANFLTENERLLVRWINVARRTPEKFAERMNEMKKTHLSPDEKIWAPPPEVNPETEEILDTHMPLMVPPQNTETFDQALQAVRGQPAMKPFLISEGLCLAAQDLVADQYVNGGASHLADDASGFRDRVQRYGKSKGGLFEILVHGIEDPLGIALWIAWNNYALQKSDRFAMFNPGLNFIGVACGAHPEMGAVAVVLIAEDYVFDSSSVAQRNPEFKAKYQEAAKASYHLRMRNGGIQRKREGGCCIIA